MTHGGVVLPTSVETLYVAMALQLVAQLLVRDAVRVHRCGKLVDDGVVRVCVDERMHIAGRVAKRLWYMGVRYGCTSYTADGKEQPTLTRS